MKINPKRTFPRFITKVNCGGRDGECIFGKKIALGINIEQMFDRIDSKRDKTGVKLDRNVNYPLLADSIHIIDIPKTCRHILQKEMGCESVKDVMELMLQIGSRRIC